MTLYCLLFGHQHAVFNKKCDYCARCRTVLYVRSSSTSLKQLGRVQKVMQKKIQALQDEPSPLWEALKERSDER